MARLVKRLSLDFGSGREGRVMRLTEPHTGLRIECGACLAFSLSLPLPSPRSHTHVHALLNKYISLMEDKDR